MPPSDSRVERSTVLLLLNAWDNNLDRDSAAGALGLDQSPGRGPLAALSQPRAREQTRPPVSHFIVRRICLALVQGTILGSCKLWGAEVDESKLPPAATNRVDFVRDIKPILDASCVRCHGPERPKSAFRLDNREAALKGGESGVDIIPGQGAKSPLIHFVARLVPDMEMPPPGKGAPLTSEQVALLLGWIDQGAAWEAAAPKHLFDASLSPSFGWTGVSGDNRKFREHYWRTDGFDGGLEHFELFEQPDPDTTATTWGHVSLHDYATTVNLRRNNLGFVRMGWQQFRKYYDDTGGRYPPPATELPRDLGTDLSLDIGKAWVDFGLTLPHWPRMVLGYEYDYTRGEEATTHWSSNFAPGDPRNIWPNSRNLDEGTHIIKFDLEAEIRQFTIEDQFRGEFYRLDSHYTDVAARGGLSQNVSEVNSYFQGANSIRLERKFKDWLFGSGGYFYSKLNADDSFRDTAVNNTTVYLAAVPQITLERETHMFNLNGLFGPFDGLTLSAGAQSEWTRQHGLGSGNLHGIAFTKPPSANLVINPATLSSDYDQNTVSESVGLRYSKIPFTSLFADARLQQESVGQSSADLQPGVSFLEKPSFSSHASDFRAGFNTSPWEPVSFTAHYRRYENESRYKTNRVLQPLGGYPGFIKWRDVLKDEVEAKLTWRALSWLKTTLSYQFVTTDYKQDTRAAFDLVPPVVYTPGGELLAGQYDSHIYSVGATMTPQRRLALTTMFSYQDTRTVTASSGIVPPYRGDVYSALASGTYILNKSTDLLLNYSFSLADYSQSNEVTGPNTPPPLGIKYQQHALQAAISWRLRKNVATRLQYGFYYYDEPTAQDVNNYTAHSIFATLTYSFH